MIVLLLDNLAELKTVFKRYWECGFSRYTNPNPNLIPTPTLCSHR